VARGDDATKPDGLYVAQVEFGGAAEAAGLRQGDIITALDGQEVTGADQLQALTLTKGPGAKVSVEFLRGDKTQTVTATLGAAG